MRKITSLFISLCIILSASFSATISVTANMTYTNESAVEIWEDFEYDSWNNTVAIKKYVGAAINLEIPASINGKKVISIDEETFAQNTTLENVTIPEGIEYIESRAFWGCSSLKNITFPNSLDSIEDSAFAYCTSLEKIHIPEKTCYIGPNAFLGTDSLTEITVSNSNQTYAVFDGALAEDDYGWALILYPSGNSATTFSIPSEIEEIRSCAFFNARFLKNITLHDDINMIQTRAFDGCSSLESINIPKKISWIEAGLFANCTSLKEITIHKKNKFFQFKDGNFIEVYDDGTASLLSHLPSAQTIEYTIPENIEVIGNYSFVGCSTLEKVTIPDHVEVIGKNAFNNTKLFDDFILSGEDLLYVDNNLVYSKSTAPEINIKEGTKLIANRVFDACNTLEKVTIPSSVTLIGHGAFYKCPNLTSVTVSEGVKEVGTDAFYECDQLSNITLPTTLTSIGEDAFRFCAFANQYVDGVVYVNSILIDASSKIEQCVIKEGTTLISAGAFKSCKKLNSVTIPETVKTICYGAFEDCKNLKYVYLPKSIEKIEEFAFPSATKEIVGYRGTAAEKLGNTGKRTFIDIETLPKKLKFNKNNLKIKKTQKRVLTLNLPKGVKATFSLENKKLVKIVNTKPKKVTIKARKKGKTVISATVAGKTAKCKVTVK